MIDAPASPEGPLDRYRTEVLVAVQRRNVVVDHDGGGHLLGWGDGTAGPRMLSDVVHPVDLERAEEAMARARPNHDARLDAPIQVRRGDGTYLDMAVTVAAATAGEAGFSGWVLRLVPAGEQPGDPGAAVPIADADSEVNRFEPLAEAVTAGILTADPDGAVTYANPAARELLWRTDAELHGRRWLDAVHAEDRAHVVQAAEQARQGGSSDAIDFRVDVVGTHRWVRALINAVSSVTGRPAGWVAILTDITDERANSDELARRATHDPLTGLPNRALLADRLAQAIARSQRSNSPLAVLFLDLDAFKAVNDRHGHRVGDRVLQTVGERIRSVIRAHDTAARLGGDEFVVVAEDVSDESAGLVAERIREAVDRPLTIDGLTVNIEASIGVAWSAGAARSPSELLDAADQAMYAAKGSGSPISFAPVTR